MPELLEAFERFMEAGADVLDAFEAGKDPVLPGYPSGLPSFDELMAELEDVREALREEADSTCA